MRLKCILPLVLLSACSSPNEPKNNTYVELMDQPKPQVTQKSKVPRSYCVKRYDNEICCDKLWEGNKWPVLSGCGQSKYEILNATNIVVRGGE